MPSLSPRDIQARIRSGESAEDVARIAGVPVDRVLRYAGPVLQERAMLAQHARRTRLKDVRQAARPLAEVVDGRLGQHGIDTEKISWDAYRREDGTWRIIATWPSGKATAQAVWELDKARQVVTPHDDMAQYLCAERPTPILGQEPRAGAARGHGAARPGPRGRAEPAAGTGCPRRAAGEHGRARAATRSGPGGTRCSPRWTVRSAPRPGRGLEPRTRRAGRVRRARQRPVGGGAAALLGGGQGRPSTTTRTCPRRSRPCRRWRCCGPAARSPRRRPADRVDRRRGKPRKRLPSWDDVLFGGGPAARESS